MRSRPRRANNFGRMDDDGASTKQSTAAVSGTTQTVARAINILVAVADGPILLVELAERLGLSTTTCYRLAKTLVDHGMMTTSGRSGYRLGYRISELGAAYEKQRRGT